MAESLTSDHRTLLAAISTGMKLTVSPSGDWLLSGYPVSEASEAALDELAWHDLIAESDDECWRLTAAGEAVLNTKGKHGSPD